MRADEISEGGKCDPAARDYEISGRNSMNIDFVHILTYAVIALFMLRRMIPLALSVLAIFWLIPLIVARKWPSRRIVMGDALTAFLGLLFLIFADCVDMHVRYYSNDPTESPDGRYCLIVESRPDFPLSGFIDPRSDVRLTLIEKESDRELQQLKLTVLEVSDVDYSDVTWTENEVTIDFGRGVTRTLQFDSTSR
jgi:hypothetical protein